MQKYKIENYKTVSFKVSNFCVPAGKTRRVKNTIFAVKNNGFAATDKTLKSGFGISPLVITVDLGNGKTAQAPLASIDGSEVKQLFCMATYQDGNEVNIVIAATADGVYYVPMFAGFAPRKAGGGLATADCFAASYSGGADYIFAANADGLFASDRSMIFKKIDTDFRAKQLEVFGNRLFALDQNGRAVYFSAALDLKDFVGSLSGQIKVDDELGKILELGSYNGKLLLVCENGFRTLETAFDPSKFALATLGRVYEPIVPGSVRALGGVIYFVTSSGLCKLEKGAVELLDGGCRGADACSIIYDSKYFLSVGGKMWVIDRFWDSVTVYENMPVRAFRRIKGELSDYLAVLTDFDNTKISCVVKAAELGPADAPGMVWESDWFALGYAADKQYVRRVLIKTAGDIDITVMNTRGERTISLKGSDSVQMINLNMKGDSFKIKIEAAGAEVQISDLSATVGY